MVPPPSFLHIFLVFEFVVQSRGKSDRFYLLVHETIHLKGEMCFLTDKDTLVLFSKCVFFFLSSLTKINCGLVMEISRNCSFLQAYSSCNLQQCNLCFVALTKLYSTNSFSYCLLNLYQSLECVSFILF